MSSISYECRFCLKKMQFEEKMAMIDNEIVEQFLNVTQIKLKLSNQLSQIVCEICLRSIQLAHALKTQFVENQRKLQTDIESVALPNLSEGLSIIPESVDEISESRCKESPRERQNPVEYSKNESALKLKVENVVENYNDEDSNQEQNVPENSDDQSNMLEEMEVNINPSDILSEVSVSNPFHDLMCEESFADDDNSQENEEYSYYDPPNMMDEMEIGPEEISQTIPKSRKRERPKSNDNLILERFSCIHCGKTYKNVSHMKRHIDAEHKKAKFMCVVPDCSGSCTRREKLKSHVISKHADLGPALLVAMLEKVKEAIPIYENEL